MTRGRRGGGRSRHDRREIERLLEERQREELSFRELSERSGIPGATLQWWSWRLRREKQGGRVRRRPKDRPDTIQFVEVATDPSAPSDTGFEITLANGRTVSVPRRFDPEALRSLLAVLEKSC